MSNEALLKILEDYKGKTIGEVVGRLDLMNSFQETKKINIAQQQLELRHKLCGLKIGD